MSSINPHYTFHYSQPEEYRFSHDSVFLARRVFELVEGQSLGGTRGLDLCAGSGIIGLDFLFHRRADGQNMPVEFDFLEVQEVYQTHFTENLKRLGEIQTQCRFLQRNYEDLQKAEFHSKYDLILCNPPYFFQGQGKLSSSEFKNRCRFFIDSDFKNLLDGIAHCLKPTGAAYVLLRDLPEHGWNVIEQAQKLIQGRLRLEVLGDIRGTHFVRLTC